MLEQTGAAHFWWGNLVMIAIGATMIYLAIAKHYEPLLLVGIGFACIVANVPGSDLILPGGLFHYAYQGVALLIIPPLIFLGVGAMTDFGPMIANPKLVILGAGAHLGIFVALIGAKLLGFTHQRSRRDRHHRRRRRPDGDLRDGEAGAASAAADLGRRLFLHGADAADPAAGDEAADHQGGAPDPR